MVVMHILKWCAWLNCTTGHWILSHIKQLVIQDDKQGRRHQCKRVLQVSVVCNLLGHLNVVHLGKRVYHLKAYRIRGYIKYSLVVLLLSWPKWLSGEAKPLITQSLVGLSSRLLQKIWEGLNRQAIKENKYWNSIRLDKSVSCVRWLC
jgi:hypothetical protein